MRKDEGWRRELGRALTREARARTGEVQIASSTDVGSGWRIGVTGPPGAGKSCCVAALARERLQRGRSVGVLAIDPTSPISGGSLLGDRLRMDPVVDDDRFYVRSMPSGHSHDGLCRNIVGLLDVLERAGFDDIVLETVGIGQTSYHARALVDTFVLAVTPGSGDIIQAMKAGIMELADIYIVNKADLPGAQKTAAELSSVLQWRAEVEGWRPSVIMTSIQDRRGFGELHDAIEAHRVNRQNASRQERVRLARCRYQIRALLGECLDEIIEARPAHGTQDVRAECRAIVADLLGQISAI
jgi:LAO/AO transport system kinase